VIARSTVKLTGLLGTPPTVTTRLPEVAAVGMVTVMLVSLQLGKETAEMPLNVTVLVPLFEPKFRPVIVTSLPVAS
jgi:hypothetical protein